MSAKLQDDRTEEQKPEREYLVGGYDKFMSGWGEGKNGSWAFWAVDLKHLDKMMEWVENRGDIVRITWYKNNVPYKRAGHVHVYCPDYAVHPAFN